MHVFVRKSVKYNINVVVQISQKNDIKVYLCPSLGADCGGVGAALVTMSPGRANRIGALQAPELGGGR